MRPDELRSELLGLVVSAHDGRILMWNTKTHDAEPFRYRVWATDDLMPEANPFCDDGLPHPTGAPDGYLPRTSCRSSLRTPPDRGAAGPWLDDGATETRGNNVDAFLHHCADAAGNSVVGESFNASLGDFRARVTSARTFDYPYDLAAAPRDCFSPGGGRRCTATDPQVNAKIVHAFFAANFLHDLFYRHGFDEASGNAQTNNFGRGGLEGDALEVAASACGTFAEVPADGVPPGLVLGRNGTSGLARGATLDFTVLAHEWMHYAQHRLIGDSNGLWNAQGKALGEGWSDFLGLLLSARAEHANRTENADWAGTYAVGAYFNEGYCDPFRQTCVRSGQDQAYYFGVRRYPYTTDLAKNPLTFRFIANDVPLPSGVPHFVWKGRVDNAEGHNAGEIWALALWHGFVELLRSGRLGFTEAQDRMVGYLVASMKATPLNPTFVEARDALLAVARATDPDDERAFKRGFAARGMGAGAVSPPRDSIEFDGVVESFRVDGGALSFLGAELMETPGTENDQDGVLDVSEGGVLRVQLRNTGDTVLENTHVSIFARGVTPGAGGTVRGLESGPGEDLFVDVPVVLDAAEFQENKVFSVEFEDAPGGVSPVRAEAAFRVHFDLFAAGRTDPATVHTAQDWQIDNLNGARGFGYPSRDAQWTSVEDGTNRLYRAPPGTARYESWFTSPWFLVAGDRNLVIRFDHAYDFTRSDGSSYGSGVVQIATDTTGFRTWDEAAGPFTQRSPSFPQLHGETLDFGRRFAHQLVQFRFGVSFDASLVDLDTGWWLDNLVFDGVLNAPFQVAVPHGTRPDGALPPQADFAVAADGMTLSFTDRSTGDGTLVSHAWQFGDGNTSREANPHHTFRLPTDSVVTMVVTDERGATAVSGRTVVPRQPLAAGVAYRGPFAERSHFIIDVPPTARRLRFEAGGSGVVQVFMRHEAPPDVRRFVVDRFDRADLNHRSGPLTFEMANPRAGRWYVSVDGATTDVTASIERVGAPRAAFHTEVDGLTARFADRSIDDDGTVVAWQWTLGDGTTSADASAVHTYAAAGTYTVRLRVTDDDGLEAFASERVIVADEAEGCACWSPPPVRGSSRAPWLVGLVVVGALWRASRGRGV